MALVVVFILGVANFALHKAVLSSGHPLLQDPAWRMLPRDGRVSLALEFIFLVAALLIASRGYQIGMWLYVIYSGFNAVAGYLLLTRKI